MERATIHFDCIFDESHFSNICTLNTCKNRIVNEKIRSSQPAIPYTELSKTVFLREYIKDII